jgi:riboflavin kinase/FMN adenylyltransferase
MGFEVIAAQPAVVNGVVVHSTNIREALATGRVEDAAALLGRPFSLTGTVQSGDGRGREIGFPTANLGPFAHATVPMDGIYATWARLGGGPPDGERHMAATSIGVRPTFGRGNERRVEAYILDFSGDIYGQKLRLEFAKRLRGEVAYSGVGPLVEQIRKDVEQTRVILSGDFSNSSSGPSGVSSFRAGAVLRHSRASPGPAGAGGNPVPSPLEGES